MITVLLPVFNNAAYLRSTIQSVLDQSFTDFELLAIEDASTDSSLEILHSFSDPRLRVIAHDKNTGLVATLNEGLDTARGKYVARVDGDDLMHPERLAKQLAHLEAHPGVTVLASFVETINSDGEPIGEWATDRACATEEEIHRMLPRTNCIAHPSVMIRLSALGSLRYAEDQRGSEDWDFWLRLRARGLRIAKLPEPLLRYRIHPTSMMSVQKRAEPVEVRLMRFRSRFLRNEWKRLRFGGAQASVIAAQARNMAGYVLRRIVKPLARDAYRLFTYSPFMLWRESRALAASEGCWKGRTVFLFPYMRIGGAEQVHADIVATVKDERPLVVFFGRSSDRSFEVRFRGSGYVLEIPRLLHHPFTRSRAHARLAALINRQSQATVFASLSAVFFDLLPTLDKDVRTVYLLHAFLFQPEGNAWWKEQLAVLPRVNRFVFVSTHSLEQFARFLHANAFTMSEREKLGFISNAVDSFGQVQEHDRVSLLFVGRDSPEKRVTLFLELCAKLEAAQPSKFRFTAVGVNAREGYPFVEFHGSVTDASRLRQTYAAHDMLVLTSDREGFPLVIMEAMAQGCAIVSTPVGDVPNRMEPSFAIVSSTIDAGEALREMQHAILAIADDRVRLLQMRNAALAHARHAFDPKGFRSHYRELLRATSGNA